MDTLIIKCPNGHLEYPSNFLKGCPYIKNTLIGKHFFGDLAKMDNIFLQFDIEIIRKLIPFLGGGIIYYDKQKDTDEIIELLEYINMANKESSLYELILQLKSGRLDAYGHEITSTKFNINDYPKFIHFSKEIQIERNNNCNGLFKHYFAIICRDNLELMAKWITISQLNPNLRMAAIGNTKTEIDKLYKQHSVRISQEDINNRIEKKINKYEYKYENDRDKLLINVPKLSAEDRNKEIREWHKFTDFCRTVLKIYNIDQINNITDQIIHLVNEDVNKKIQN